MMNVYTLYVKNGGKNFIVEQDRHNLTLDNARAKVEVANYRKFVEEAKLKGEFGVSATDQLGYETWLDEEGRIVEESDAFWQVGKS